MRRFAFSVASATLLLGAGPLCAQPRTSGGEPSLVVLITVDQMRPDYIDVYAPQLTGGLARLVKGGAVFTNAFQDHGITETAPGHASTLSGRFPRSTGIVANNAGVLDPEAPLLGVSGPTAEPASPFRFRGTTLADWMRYDNPRTRALSVSRKDRGAILPLGRARGEAFWYATNGTFTTSTYYHDVLPGWVSAFNARRIPQSYAGKVWDLLLPPSAYTEPDTVEQESGGNDYVFPHPFPPDAERAAAVFAAYPAMDSLTFQFALAGLDAMELGKSETHTDLLAVSVSTTDAVGHRFGPDSREMHDQILRLDRYLGAFIDSLYRVRDSSRIVFALTADHAVAPIPDAAVKSRYRPPPEVGGRGDVIPAVRALYQGLAAAKVDTAAYWWDDGFLVLEPEGFEKARVNRDSVARAFAAAVERLPGVLRADLVSDLARTDTTKDAIARRWLHMFPPELPATVTVTMKPYWYRGSDLVATHGSPHDYDAHVPVIFYGPWIKPGRYGEFSRVVDIAPTFAAIVGVRPLERLDGHVLKSAIR